MTMKICCISWDLFSSFLATTDTFLIISDIPHHYHHIIHDNDDSLVLMIIMVTKVMMMMMLKAGWSMVELAEVADVVETDGDQRNHCNLPS